ncbi:MAG TPA: DedA family protein [Gemmatimonadales bacterium]|jgi:membrane protein DedA with SNARE-associated domain
MFEAAVTWITETIFRLGYPGIMLLMALESSFFPFPSEVVLPPAGYLAAQGRMSAVLAFAAGTAGSLIGAVFNYYVALWLGRPLLHRYSRYVLIREQSLDRAEEFFRRHGEISTFVGRLIPVIRQLISLPAGLSRMRLDRFALYTSLGAGIWCAVLAAIGWYVGKNASVVAGIDELIAQPAFHRYSTIAGLILLPALALIVGAYVLVRRRSGSGQASGGPTE